MATAAPDEHCVFCAILAGRQPASFVYTGDDVVAFLDIRPLTRGHLLVIPRAHADRLETLDPAAGARMFSVAQQLAVRLRRSGFGQGTDLFLADGAAAGQEVFHVHLHVIPRTQGDGFGLRARRPRRAPARGELDATAGAIRKVTGPLPR
ncbi:MAG TPA: HIT family protein [Streptosporangiaceae bacterium]|nr:HIT family protein [Streptosporangiaceae bacterium]